MIARLLRTLAILIAVAALIDPAVTHDRPVPPVIELAVAPGSEALGNRVKAALRSRFSVVAAPVALAAARVVVGNLPAPERWERRVAVSGPASVRGPGGSTPFDPEPVPAFVVLPDPALLRPAVATLTAPARAPLNARVPVDVTVHTSVAGPAVEVELEVDGLLADRMALPAVAPESPLQATLSFMPSRPGPHHLRVTAGRVDGRADEEAWADALVTVDDEPWHVLVYDPRPSWSSTFVRRVLDRDARFEVVTRVAVSPDAAVASGPLSRGGSFRASSGLGEVASLRDVDVVVVGAPGALALDEVETLRRFMRGRGGSVVLLIDADPGGAGQLGGALDWKESLASTPAALVAADGVSALWASEVVVPNPLPAGATVLARIDDTGAGAPVVWRRPVGAGRLVVSGALDAWRFRAAAGARFDDFWRRVIADVAAAAPPAIGLKVAPSVGRPGESVRVDVTVRDVALAAEPVAEFTVRSWLDGGEDPVMVRLWPSTKGRFSGQLLLPDDPGSYRLVVETAGGFGAAADLVVVADAAAAGAADAELLDTWATAHGGVAVPESRLDELVAALDDAVEPGSATLVGHPMRSAWWIVPFAFALGGEWWIRRRRGQR